MEPSYSDVAGEDETWTPRKIFNLYDKGMNKADIARALRTTDTTVRRHLILRKEGKIAVSNRIFARRRRERS